LASNLDLDTIGHAAHGDRQGGLAARNRARTSAYLNGQVITGANNLCSQLSTVEFGQQRLSKLNGTQTSVIELGVHVSDYNREPFSFSIRSRT
jgi:hypothetical protein